MLQVKFLSKALCAVAGVFLLAGLGQAADDLLAQAKALLEQRRAQEAYALLIPQQSKRAGDPNYDYLLGIAALDSGRPGEAVFALERVLAVNPSHLQARAEIARAYFMLNENDSAKQEFEAVKGQNPPPEVTETIQRYLSAIDQRVDATRTRIGGYVEVGYGSDSNVNSATSETALAVPSLDLTFPLGDNGRQRKDKVTSTAVGVTLTHPFSPSLGLFTGVNGKQRDNRKEDEFDLDTIDGNLGLRYLRGREQLSLAYQTLRVELNDQKYRNSNGGNAQWQHSFDGRNMGTLYLQHSQFRYPEQSLRDGTQIIGGGAFAHAFRSVNAPVGFVGLYYGQEEPKVEDRPDLAYTFYGLRLGGQYGLRSDINIIGGLSTQYSRYKGEDSTFDVHRRDRRYDASLALEYVLKKQWVIRPEVTFARNDSNVVLNDFRRTEAFASVRYNFN